MYALLKRVFALLSIEIGPRLHRDLAPKADSLPVVVRRRRSRLLAVAMCLLGLGLLAGGIMVATACFEVSRPLGLFLGAAAVSPGLAAALVGIVGLLHREKWRFTREEVSYRRRGLCGSEEWEEPLANYAGVLAKTRRRGTKSTQPRRAYVVELHHPADETRCVELYRGTTDAELYRKQEHYARLFGVDALTETAYGMNSRTLEELGRSLQERVVAGSLAVEFDPRKGPPGRGLRVRIEDNFLRIRTRRALGPACAVLGVLLTFLGLACVLLQLAVEPDVSSWLMLTIGSGIAGVGQGAFLMDRLVHQELLVSPKQVRVRWRTPLGALRGEAIAPASIKEAYIRKPVGETDRPRLILASDAKVLHFGKLESRAEAEWLRNCVVAAISSGA